MAASRNDLYCLFRNHHQGIFTHHEIKPLIKKFSFDTWLVVDLDDTVFEAACESELGGTRWYDFLYRLACELFPGDEFAASRIATKLDNAVKEHAPMKSVEEIMVIIIHTLQEMGIPVIGLTARDKSIHKLTERELNRIGVDFSRTKMMVQANTGDKHTDNLTRIE